MHHRYDELFSAITKEALSTPGCSVIPMRLEIFICLVAAQSLAKPAKWRRILLR